VLRFSLAVILALGAFAVRAHAQLAPAEVALVVARGNAESERLAEYYVSKRNIPAENVCPIDVPKDEELSRQAWTDDVRPAIRQWLAEHDPDNKLLCLTTVWGVPLSIGAAEPNDALRRYREYLAGERLERIKQLRKAVEQCNVLAPAGAITTDAPGAAAKDPPPAPPMVTLGDDAPPSEMIAHLETVLEASLKAAQLRIAAMPVGQPRQNAQQTLQQTVAAAGGAGVILQNLQQQFQSSANATLQGEFDRLRGATAAWVEARQVLEAQPPSIDRDAAVLAIVERLAGHLGAVRWLDAQLAIVARGETGASFDSELALVRWDDGYELLRWQPNYLQLPFANSQLRRTYPTLMTARLDAPTLALAKGLIDASLAAEAAGLQGKAYLDARGLAATQQAAERGSAAAFDAALVAAGEGLNANTTIEAVIDNQPPPFQAGACPDAALYAGWYSLGKYVDAFEWQSGAIAYHAGGSEAARLHDAASQRWCKRLLEDGAAATIGAVAEPGIAGYPRPDEFFASLLRGDLTLAEAYWQTVPGTSWQMVLIGDPLYRPFANRNVRPEGSVLRDAGR
jgi:uncharacterized protein (TIGR03790 family)